MMQKTGVKMTVGEWLKKGRKSKGMTLQDVASLTNSACSVSYICRLESDARKNPSMDKLQILAHVLELDLNDVLENPVAQVQTVHIQTQREKELVESLETQIKIIKQALKHCYLLETAIEKLNVPERDSFLDINQTITKKTKEVMKEVAFLQASQG